MFKSRRIYFYGGPFDGLDWPWPKSDKVDRLILVEYDPDPTQLALYGIRESALVAQDQEIIYDYAGMISATAE
ncbi:hypothetical protein OG746_26825 [Streptomyces sp. NBC_01016]|uniref:hypothetical protein n=1 Tax=Streptomyces sp. NBC_01016 TaxID=2903720 RepID=UPI0022524BD8|nr:hypothetical protein [Streptomyces sp. NBC_01016]MCX4827155.1 hypothetical protein [Streptomyces sp. NBC_01016]MCX4832356.1 hypothetical protein [Streptomyces sp. NBC_01016]